MKKVLFAFIALTLSATFLFAGGGKKGNSAGGKNVTFYSYFSGVLASGIDDLVTSYNAKNPDVNLKHTPVDHEAFKTSIRTMLAGGNPPDIFSYWAGARVQFIVDADRLEPIDDLFAQYGLNDVMPEAVQQGCVYNGQKYFVPITQHFVPFFYNKEIFASAGVSPPETWDEFLNVCAAIKEAGYVPIALGSKERWPAQFWLDYPLLRTAGPDYRAKLMSGEASYTDPEVVSAFEMWKDLLDAGYFNENPNAYDYAEASAMVGRGEAAMTLMGTWFMQLDDQIGIAAGSDYDYFVFPVVDDSVPVAAVGPFDGVVVSKGGKNKEQAKEVVAALMDVELQAEFAKGSMCLSPNKNVPDSTYNSLQISIKNYIESEVQAWAFNYDLATPPPVADVGLDGFTRFLDNPGDYINILADIEAGAKKAFAEAN